MPEELDLLVIGGGSGGMACSRRAAEYGARVALVESHRLGGTCVNVGCVPKKIMWNAASFGQGLADAPDYGFDLTRGAHDWAALKRARDAYIVRLNEIYAANLEESGVRLLRGRARMIAPGRVTVNGHELRARQVVIATGGRPIVPDRTGAELGIVSDDFFELPARPERVGIIGSGYVSAELSGVFAALGSRVTILMRGERILRDFDIMLSETLMQAMTNQGIELRTGQALEGLRRGASGVDVVMKDGSCAGPFDSVLWAVGREPNTEGLGLDAIGIERDADGFIVTDLYQDTNLPNVHAIGDVTGREALTPVAIAAGRRLADRLFGGATDRHLDYELIPTVIFTHPPIGTIGLTEAQAVARFPDRVRVHRSSFGPLYYALTRHKERAEMKLVTLKPEERIVGLHVIGLGADEMLQGFAVAIRMGATKKDFDDTVAIHPTSAEEFVTMV
jgi:glutathione reductase (NADPH)